MKSDRELVRKILTFSYCLLDEKDTVSFEEIVSAPELKSYDKREIVNALNEIHKKEYVVLQPNLWGDRQPFIVDVTFEGCACMRGKL